MTKEVNELISRCLTGDRDAQRELYEQYHRSVYRMVARMVGHAQADDVTQDVFVKVFRGLRGFRGTSEFSTWLYRIAINECLRQRGSGGLPPSPLHEEPIDPTGEPGQQLEQAELLERALNRLDAQLRAVFLLRELEGLTYDQIASVLEIPPGTVASQLNRAKTQLRDFLRRM
ncbi:MAG: RNA polymerase sigma factor [Planctomycetes bacterium]|nr:RNA polymerase sigma factor [Planctomycetota bacterium]